MHLSKVNQALNHRISGGSEYQWDCYGYNVRFLDYESDYAHASVVFDTQTQIVYEAQVNSKDEDVKPYRWLNPDTKEKYLAECKERNIDPNNAWDNVSWVDTETTEDFLEKAEAIINGVEFDTRIKVPLDLDKEELFKLMSMAHERDLTLNELVEDILWDVINTHKKKELSEYIFCQLCDTMRRYIVVAGENYEESSYPHWNIIGTYRLCYKSPEW